MRWDFFRYLLDIHSLTLAGSKDGGGGGPQEISGCHKDRDKSQPQLLSTKSLHHHQHQHQLIVSLSPTSTTANNGQQHDQENDNSHQSGQDSSSTADKKSSHSQQSSGGGRGVIVTIIIPDPSMPSSSSSPAMKTAIEIETNSPEHPPPIINYNENSVAVPLDDSINQNVCFLERNKAFLISESSPQSSSSLSTFHHQKRRTATTMPNKNCKNYGDDDDDVVGNGIHHSILTPSSICSPNHSKDKLMLIPNRKQQQSLKIVTVKANINLHKNGHERSSSSNSGSPRNIEQNGNNLLHNGNGKPVFCACPHFSSEKLPAPNSKEKGIYSININEARFADEEENEDQERNNDTSHSHPSQVRHYYDHDHFQPHCSSLSSSTDAHNAEAEIVLRAGRATISNKNEKGLIIANGQQQAAMAIATEGNFDEFAVATEDEASSIASSFCSSSATLGGGGGVDDGLINGDEADIDAKTIKRSETSDTNSTTTSINTNSAENHLPLEDKPSALFESRSRAVMSSSSYGTLRWTKAVANQENLAQIQQNHHHHHSLPRYLHQQQRERELQFPHHKQFYTPSGTVNREGKKVGMGAGANKKISAENDLRGDGGRGSGSSPFFSGYNNAASNAPISNIISSGTTCSKSVVVTASDMEKRHSSCRIEAMNGNRLSASTLLQQHHHPPLTRPTSIIGGDIVVPSTTNNRLLVFQDKWRVLFDKFDREGFGEITWTDFLFALRSKEFQLAVEPGKLQLLEDLATAHSSQTNSITFQLFVNIMTGKRSRSFKCAVHHRDREVCSESDFHLLPLGYQSPTGVKRMARLIADEFLTDERDRKYYADHYRCLPPPLFIISITLIELGFFTYYTVWHGEISSSGPLPMDSPFVYRPDKRQEVWRFLFYMVLHAGWVHLMFNLLVQLLVGLPLEMVHGSLRIGCVYMAGVLAGSLGTSVFDPDVYLVGASGGVYALLAAHLANVLLNYNNMEFGLVRLLGVFLIASVDVGFAIYDRYAASPPLTEGSVPPVSYVAHLTGALAGLTIGLLVLKNFEQKLREQLMWWLALGVYAACTLFAILFNIFHPVYPEMIPTEFVELPEKFPHHQIQ